MSSNLSLRSPSLVSGRFRLGGASVDWLHWSGDRVCDELGDSSYGDVTAMSGDLARWMGDGIKVVVMVFC